MKKLLRIIAVAVLGVSLSTGMAAAHSSIDTTGPDSDNVVRVDNDTDVDVDNDADLDIDNDSDQDARSGNATVSGNTNGGDASTGNASNSNVTTTSLHLSF